MAKLIMWNLMTLGGFAGSGTALFEKSPEKFKLKLLDAKPYSTGIVVLRHEPRQ